QGGTMTVKVANVSAGAKYIFCVQVDGAWTKVDAAQFAVAATFTSSKVTSLESFAAGALDATHGTVTQSLSVTESRTVHLALAATDDGGSANDSVRMTVRDASGKVI